MSQKSNKSSNRLEFQGQFGRLRSFNNRPDFKEIEGCISLYCFFCALKKGLIGSPVNLLLNDASFFKALTEILKVARKIVRTKVRSIIWYH